MMTGVAAKDMMTSALDDLKRKFTRVTRNWSQNNNLHVKRGYVVPGELQYMCDKKDEAEVAAYNLLARVGEDVDLYQATLKKMIKVRVEMSALTAMPSRRDAPDAPPVTVPDMVPQSAVEETKDVKVLDLPTE